MAHEIDMSNGKPSVAFIGEVPWHGLGTKLEPNSPLTVWCKEAGLDWIAKESPVHFLSNGEYIEIPNSKTLYRSDNNIPLSIVSKEYKTVQPIEALNFYKDLIDSGSFKMNTAGSLRDGRKIWALAETNKEEELLPNDRTKGYLLFSTSYDKTLSTIVTFTTVRVVCNNTLNMSLSLDYDSGIKIPHNRLFNGDEVKERLGLSKIVDKTWSNFKTIMDVAIKTKIEQEKAIEILTMAFIKQGQNFNEAKDNKAVKKIIDLFNGEMIGADIKGVMGNGYGLIQAADEYIDHHARNFNQSTRLNSIWFGAGNRAKQIVLQNVLKLAA